MVKPGTNNMIRGAFLIIIGIGFTVFSGNSGVYIVSYFFYGFGILRICWGLYKNWSFRSAMSDAHEVNMSGQYFTTLVRSMVEMSMVDGHLDDTEVDIIIGIIDRVTNQIITPETVHEYVEAVQNDEESFHDKLQSAAGIISDDHKERIIHASYLVLLADGEEKDEEYELLYEIARELSMDIDSVRSIVMTISHALEDEKEAQARAEPQPA